MAYTRRPLQDYPYGIGSWDILSSATKWQLLIMFWAYFFQRKKSLTVWFLPMVFVWLPMFGEARKGCLKKEDLSGSPNCLPSYPSITAHANSHTIEETARNGHERERTHKSNSALVNCFIAFKGRERQTTQNTTLKCAHQETNCPLGAFATLFWCKVQCYTEVLSYGKPGSDGAEQALSPCRVLLWKRFTT